MWQFFDGARMTTHVFFVGRAIFFSDKPEGKRNWQCPISWPLPGSIFHLNSWWSELSAAVASKNWCRQQLEAMIFSSINQWNEWQMRMQIDVDRFFSVLRPKDPIPGGTTESKGSWKSWKSWKYSAVWNLRSVCHPWCIRGTDQSDCWPHNIKVVPWHPVDQIDHLDGQGLNKYVSLRCRNIYSFKRSFLAGYLRLAIEL